MSVFKEEADTKRVIFNVRLDLAQRLDQAKKDARDLGKKLDVDGAIDKALEKYLKKAEKKISEVHKKRREEGREGLLSDSSPNAWRSDAETAGFESDDAERGGDGESRETDG
jgi:vacuolar-type H+-ATPase subunit H